MGSVLVLWCSRARVLPCNRVRVLWRSGVLVLWALGAGCAGAPKPEPIDVGREACAYCRMTISQSGVASQALAPGELPKFFDDLGCLAHFLKAATEVAEGSVIYVMDHRTREWVRAEQAVFSRVPMLATPMSSHLAAHASVASRDADPNASAGSLIPLSEIVPAAWQAKAGRR